MFNMTSIECNSSTTREPYRTITLVLLRFYPIVFLLVGTIGNLLSVYVVLRSKLRRYSTFIYLAFLSIVDLIVLYTFSIHFLFHAWFNIDLQQVSLIACKIYSFSIYFSPQASAWILTAVSIDRVCALTRGIRKTRNTRLTYSILVIIFLTLFLLNVQFLFYDNTYQLTYSMQTTTTTTNHHLYRIVDTDMDINVIQCSLENIDEYKQFYRNIWVYVDATVNVYLPFTLMFLCSTIIFLSVLRTMGNANNSNKRIIAKNLSTMLLSINTMFVLLSAPIVIYLMFEKQIISSNTYECHTKIKAKYKMIKLLCIILMNANHTGNILVYCLMGTEFRTQLLYIMRKHRNFPEHNYRRHQPEIFTRDNQLQVSMRKRGGYGTSRIKTMGESMDMDEDHLVHRHSSRDERRYILSKQKQHTQSSTTTSV